MTFTFKASTSEEMKNEIVKWLKASASNRRNQARLCASKIKAKEHNIAATALDNAAMLIARIEITKS